MPRTTETLTELLDRVDRIDSRRLVRAAVERQDRMATCDHRLHHALGQQAFRQYEERDSEWSCPECHQEDKVQEEADWRRESDLESARADLAKILESIAEGLARAIGTDVPEIMQANERVLSRRLA